MSSITSESEMLSPVFFEPQPPGQSQKDDCKDVRKNLNLIGEFATPKVARPAQHMKVYLRVRPFSAEELERNEQQHCINQEDSQSIVLHAPKDSVTFKNTAHGCGKVKHKFSFSEIFNEETTQKKFFDETMLTTVKNFVDGQNCLVFTFGVTSSGKTHTILGKPHDSGILPRSLDVVFNSISGKQMDSMYLKPKLFCDVSRLNENQIQIEEIIKQKVMALASSDDEKVADSASEAPESDASRLSSASRVSSASSAVSDESGVDEPKKFTGVSEPESDIETFEDLEHRVRDEAKIDIANQGEIRFSIWVSFAEIYNEYIYDLLEPLPKKKNAKRPTLKLSEDKNGTPYIKGLKWIHVTSADEAFKVLTVGQKHLRVASTKLNHNSSRSHCVFTIKIVRVVNKNNPNIARISMLSFCDLAGSERNSKSKTSGTRIKEAGHINTSLMTLGRCIETLRYNQHHKGQNQKVIPFRDSKLTRLFQSFFCGQGRASMIVNINQNASMFDETLHVLKFSAIAKQVQNIQKPIEEKVLPARTRTLSLALMSTISKCPLGRASVAWCTPGTYQKIIEEEEVTDEPSIASMEEDLDTTLANNSFSTREQELLSAIEYLQNQVSDMKKELVLTEARVREEVCKEMGQLLVKIEQDCSERIEEERLAAEERAEYRIKLYKQSVNPTRKRARIDQPDDEDEALSVPLKQFKEIEHQLKNRDEEVLDLNEQMTALKLELDSYEQRLRNVTEDRNESRERISTLRFEMADITRTKSQSTPPKKFNDTITEICNNELVDTMSRQLEQAQDQLKEQETDVKELHEMLNEAGGALQGKELETEKLKAAILEDERRLVMQDQTINELKRVVSEMQQAMDIAEQKIFKQSEKICSMEDDCQHTLQELKEAHALIESLKDQKHELTDAQNPDDIQDLQIRISELEAELDIQQSSSSHRKETTAELESRLDEVKEMCAKLTSRLQNAEQNLKMRDEEFISLQTVFEDCRKNNSDLISKNRLFEDTVKDITCELERKESTVQVLIAEKRFGNDEFNKEKKLNSEYLEKLSSVEKKLLRFECITKEQEGTVKEILILKEQLETDLEVEKACTAELRHLVKDAENKLKQQGHITNEHKSKIQNLKDELNYERSCVLEFNTTIQCMEAEVEKEKEQINSVNTDLNTLRALVHELEEQVKEKDLTITEMASNLKHEVRAKVTSQKQLEISEEMSTVTSERHQCLEKGYDQIEKNYIEIMAENKQIKEELEEAVERHMADRKHVDDLEVRILQLKASLEIANSCQEEALEDRGAVIDNIKEELKKEYETSRLVMEERIQVLKGTNEMSSYTHEEHLSDLRQKVEDLEKELLHKSNKLEEECNTKHTLSDKLQEYEDAEDKLQATKQALQQFSSLHEIVIKERDNLSERVDSLESDIIELKKKCYDLTEPLNEAKENLRVKQAEYSQLEKRHVDLEKKLVNCEISLEDNEVLCDSLKSQLGDQLEKYDKLLSQYGALEKTFEHERQVNEEITEKLDTKQNLLNGILLDLERAEKDLINLKMDKNSADSSNSDFVNELKQLKLENEDLICAIKEKGVQMSELSLHLENLNKLTSDLRTQVNEQIGQLSKAAELETKQKNLLDEKEKCVLEMNAKLASVQNAAASDQDRHEQEGLIHMEQISSLEADVKKVDLEKDAAIRDLTTKICIYKEELNIAQRQLNELSEKEKGVVHLQQKVQEMELNAARRNAKIVEKNQIIEDLTIKAGSHLSAYEKCLKEMSANELIIGELQSCVKEHENHTDTLKLCLIEQETVAAQQDLHIKKKEDKIEQLKQDMKAEIKVLKSGYEVLSISATDKESQIEDLSKTLKEKDKFFRELEKELKDKEEVMEKWRKEKDDLVQNLSRCLEEKDSKIERLEASVHCRVETEVSKENEKWNKAMSAKDQIINELKQTNIQIQKTLKFKDQVDNSTDVGNETSLMTGSSTIDLSMSVLSNVSNLSAASANSFIGQVDFDDPSCDSSAIKKRKGKLTKSKEIKPNVDIEEKQASTRRQNPSSAAVKIEPVEKSQPATRKGRRRLYNENDVPLFNRTPSKSLETTEDGSDVHQTVKRRLRSAKK